MESQRRIELIAHADPAVRDAALALVDELPRPFDAGELERELVQYYTRKKAREIIHALKFFDVVLLRADGSETPKHNRPRPLYGSPSQTRQRKVCSSRRRSESER